MNRITDHYAVESMQSALSRLPWSLRWLGDVTDLFTEDPVFAGLHEHEATFDNRSYRNTAHVLVRAGDIRATIVVPEKRIEPAAMVHELGHVLDWWFGYRWCVPAVSEYAQSNAKEAFAEWLAAWTCNEYRHVRRFAENPTPSRELWTAIVHSRWDGIA